MALRYLYASVTQGSADAFAEASITTALSGLTTQAMRVRELLVQWPPAAVAAANNVNVYLSLTRVTFGAIPTVGDLGVIWIGARRNALVTSGAVSGELIDRYTFDEDDNVLIVEDPIYMQIDSDNTAVANVGRIRVGYEIVNINATERLSLRLDALQAS